MAELTFGEALDVLNAGGRVARRGWNGKGMYLRIVRNSIEVDGYELLDYIGMKTADDKFVPWLASQTDVLATDWIVA